MNLFQEHGIDMLCIFTPPAWPFSLRALSFAYPACFWFPTLHVGGLAYLKGDSCCWRPRLLSALSGAYLLFCSVLLCSRGARSLCLWMCFDFSLSLRLSLIVLAFLCSLYFCPSTAACACVCSFDVPYILQSASPRLFLPPTVSSASLGLSPTSLF